MSNGSLIANNQTGASRAYRPAFVLKLMRKDLGTTILPPLSGQNAQPTTRLIAKTLHFLSSPLSNKHVFELMRRDLERGWCKVKVCSPQYDETWNIRWWSSLTNYSDHMETDDFNDTDRRPFDDKDTDEEPNIITERDILGYTISSNQARRRKVYDNGNLH